MALIQNITRGGHRRHSRHDPVERTLGYVFDIGGVRYAQFDSYGRKSRDEPDKVSQSIQVEEEGARAIISLLSDAFPNLR